MIDFKKPKLMPEDVKQLKETLEKDWIKIYGELVNWEDKKPDNKHRAITYRFKVDYHNDLRLADSDVLETILRSIDQVKKGVEVIYKERLEIEKRLSD